MISMKVQVLQEMPISQTEALNESTICNKPVIQLSTQLQVTLQNTMDLIGVLRL